MVKQLLYTVTSFMESLMPEAEKFIPVVLAAVGPLMQHATASVQIAAIDLVVVGDVSRGSNHNICCTLTTEYSNSIPLCIDKLEYRIGFSYGCAHIPVVSDLVRNLTVCATVRCR